MDEPREWLFIDSEGRDRFKHDGDTIIPGAGVSWKHLHRGRAQPAKARKESNYDSSSSDGEGPTRTAAAEVGCTALQEQAPDDEDELPWQVIAILDRQTMRDMRYTQRCYEQNIQTALSGERLPRPALAGVEDTCTSGCWLFLVVALRGVEVRTDTDAGAPVVGFCARGEYVKGVEQRGAWLRLRSSSQPTDKQREIIKDGVDVFEEMWVFVGDGDSPRLEAVAEEDMPSLETELPEQPEADAFDRPFEPRLEGPNMSEQTEDSREGHEEDEASPVVEAASAVLLPAHQREHAVGTEVVLEGLNKESCNGQCATVVTRLAETGRQGVRLANGERISVKAINLRPILADERGPLGRHARVLGLNLAVLGLIEPKARGGSLSVASTSVGVEDAKELVGAALRAAHRDLGVDSRGAHRDAQAAHDALVGALENLSVAAAAKAAAPQDKAAPAAAHIVASMTRSPLAAPTLSGAAPHEVVECGALGVRAAEAAALAGSAESLEVVEGGVAALRQLLVDEQARLRRAGLQESADALRLRLTVVRALLRGRLEADAAAEAAVARRLHPTAAAAALWQGRCLLRRGQREEAVVAFAAAAKEPSGPDGAWAGVEARRRLRAAREAARCEARAKDAYARGLFQEAASLYGDAIASAGILDDDRWARAERHANRASCRRRDREFEGAIADLDVALRLFPCYKRAHFRRGVCLLEFGDPQGAVTSFETLLRLDRAWPNLLDWLVRAHACQRRKDSGAGRDRRSHYCAPPFAESGQWAEALEAKDIAHEKDHYTVLGVPTDATEKQLKRAYRLMSLKFHPDKEGGSTRAFQRVATAYQTLSDPGKRQLYDEGADLKQGRGSNDSESDDEREQQSLREEIERKYFPDRYKFWPFGDPFVQKRKRQERMRQRSGRPAFYEEDI